MNKRLSWLSLNRQLAKDYESLSDTKKIFIYMAMRRILLKKLA